MTKKISALFLVFGFLLNGVGMVFAASTAKKTVGQNTPLAALLPASDGAVTINMRRVLSEALPQVLSSNQTMLNKILGEFDKIKNDTGLDLRQFDQIAVGVSSKKGGKDITFEPVVLARGTFKADALIAAAKANTKTKYREEKIGGRTAYIFSGKQAVAEAKSRTAAPQGSVFDTTTDKMFRGLSGELAVTVYDENTLAIGSTARVREALDTKRRISADVLDLVNGKPNALVSFGLKVPNGLSQFVDMDNDEIGKSLNSIRQIYGTVDVGGGNVSVSVAAKTLEAAQAKSLYETLEGLQSIGKVFIGSSKGADKKVYARMIDGAIIKQIGNEVTLDLTVAQSDIDILVGTK
jgi:hypothetical protein